MFVNKCSEGDTVYGCYFSSSAARPGLGRIAPRGAVDEHSDADTIKSGRQDTKTAAQRDKIKI